MEWLIETVLRYPRRSAAVMAAMLVLGGGLLWWHLVWQNPATVFQGMLADNLATTSVTKVASAGTATQGVEQTVRLQMGSTNATNWLVSARQSGGVVTTESIATPAAGYIRYVQIGSGQTSRQVNFAGVINVWAKSDGQTDAPLNDLFGQAVLDISSAPLPPIGNLTTGQQAELLQFMTREKVFQPDYSKVKLGTVGGHGIYIYQVSVHLAPYVRLMQAFADDLGLTSLKTLDSGQYSTLPPITVMMFVDPSSHQLLRVTYPATAFSQDYQDWGLERPIVVPPARLTTTQLQARLQALTN